MNLYLDNTILQNNHILIQCLIILQTTGSYDMLFNVDNDKVIIRMKGPKNWQQKISKYYPEITNNILDYIPIDQYNHFLFQLKLGSSMNIVEKMIQSGSFQCLFGDQKYSIRVSVHPSNQGESLSIRMIHPITNKVLKAPSIVSGINLIVGPTCSGKTTLMYSMMENYAKNGKIIISLEDPVERELSFCSQTSLEQHQYDEAIKSALRQNPDLITIGEIRDKFCAQSIIHGALTGHNVLATIHGISNKSYAENRQLIIMRLVEMGINKDSLESLLNQIIFCNDFKYIKNPLFND